MTVPSLATTVRVHGRSAGLLLDLPTSPFGRLTPDWLYYVRWGIAACSSFVAALCSCAAGAAGRFRAIREDELAAVSSGVGLPRYKTLAFGVSAFFAGVAGSLYAIHELRQPGHVRRRALDPAARRGRRRRLGDAPGVIFGAVFIQYMPLYAPDILAPVINAAQRSAFR